MGSVSTTSPVLDHFLVVAASSQYGFAWGKGKTLEAAQKVCKMNGGKVKNKGAKAYRCHEETWVDDFGSVHYPAVNLRPEQI